MKSNSRCLRWEPSCTTANRPCRNSRDSLFTAREPSHRARCAPCFKSHQQPPEQQHARISLQIFWKEGWLGSSCSCVLPASCSAVQTMKAPNLPEKLRYLLQSSCSFPNPPHFGGGPPLPRWDPDFSYFISIYGCRIANRQQAEVIICISLRISQHDSLSVNDLYCNHNNRVSAHGLKYPFKISALIFDLEGRAD